MEGGVIEHELHHLQQVVAEDVRIPLTDGGELDVIDRLRGFPAELGQGLDAHLLHLLDDAEQEVRPRILGVEATSREAERTLELQRLMTGGTIRACKTALRTGGVAVNLGGGFHHALPDEGQGFCVFNDCGVAIETLRHQYGVQRVAYVDIDEFLVPERDESISAVMARYPDAEQVLALGKSFEQSYYQALDDDFNTAKALGLAFELARAINRLSQHKQAMRRAGPVVAPALAALACGFFWEMWNYFSLAKWEYSVPLVHRFLIFEMPLLGYGGYLPFGLECMVIGAMLENLVNSKHRNDSISN